MARAIRRPDPVAVVPPTRREIAIADAISVTEIALEGAAEIRATLRFIERHCESGPVKATSHLSTTEHIKAALVLAWDALSSVECGVEQAREFITELRAEMATEGGAR